MPRLEGVFLDHESVGLVILGVAVQDAPANAGEPGKVADRYGPVALPVQFWIARDRVVRGWAFGELPIDQYDPALAKILPVGSSVP